MGPAEHAGATGGALGQAVSGLRLLLDALSLLRRERSLWQLALIPIALSMLAVLVALAGIVGQADWIYQLAAGWLPTLRAGAWYTWLWIGPAKLGLALAGYLLFAAASATIVLVSFLLANVLAAPVLDLLSQRVELIVSGQLVENPDSSVRAIALDVGRSLSSELRRLLFLASIWAVLFVLGAVIPGGQLVAPLLMMFVTLLFLPLEYSGHVLDRRQVPFRVRRSWLRAHLPLMVGFGGAAFLTCLVPGLNFLMIPCLVVAGTMLAVRHPPDWRLPA